LRGSFIGQGRIISSSQVCKKLVTFLCLRQIRSNKSVNLFTMRKQNLGFTA